MPADTSSQFPALCCEHNNETAPVRRADFSGNQSAIGQSVEDAGQCRSFVGEAAVKIAHMRGGGIGQQRENMRLALREVFLAQFTEIKPDPMCGSVNRMDEMQWHRVEGLGGLARPMTFELSD